MQLPTALPPNDTAPVEELTEHTVAPDVTLHAAAPTCRDEPGVEADSVGPDAAHS